MISYENRRAVYENAIDAYGIRPQLLMVLEEMSELQKEICKNFRGKDNRTAIAEECADLTIMLEQLRLIFGINDEVNLQMDLKVRRLDERIRDFRQQGGYHEPPY